MKEILSKIKVICFDFDGVLTDNAVYVDENGRETVRCSRSDGIGFDRIKSHGIISYIISSEKNPVVSVRAKKLDVMCIQGVKNKGEIIRSLIKESQLAKDEVAFVGNDVNDISAFNESGVSIAVADAWPEVLAAAKVCIKTPGGYGVVREIADLISGSKLEEDIFNPIELCEPESVGFRDWGSEDILVHSPKKYTLKRLIIKKGHGGGLQLHRLKDEGGVVIKGRLKVKYFNPAKNEICELILKKGDAFRFPPYCVHQEQALSDVEIMEVSTPHFNDRVRMEPYFNIKASGGLPSTTLSEVEFR